MKSETAVKKRHHLIREVAETVLLALLMFLALRFAIQNFTIDGTSMEQSLHNGELILVDKWTYLFHPPARGDVVVFRAPPDPTQDYIKRVIGLPGDTITIKGTVVIVDGVPLTEPYVATQNQGIPPGARSITDLEVPPDDYFVLGDNRAVSSDSRIWGFLPARNIIGRAAIVYWPLGQNNDGLLPGVGNVFSGIERGNAQAAGPLSVIMANLNTLWLLLIPTLLLLYLRRKSLKRWLMPAPMEKDEEQP